MDKKNKNPPKKLISLCLDCIIEHFKTFMDIYFHTKNKPRKEFEYLQRTYSVVLLDKVQSAHHNISQYSEFLFNHHLKNVDLYCQNFTDTTILNRLQNIGPTIEKLRLQGNGLFYENWMLELSPFLTNLETLNLHMLDISAEILICIRKNCPVLKSLDLSTCIDVTNKCIEVFCIGNGKALEKNYTLQYLYLTYTDTTKTGIACALENLPNLKTNSTLCSKTYKIQEISISNINNYNFKFIEMCPFYFPNVKILKVSEISLQSQVDALSKFMNLNEVNFKLSSISIDVTPFIKERGKYLEILKIYQGSVSVDSLLKFCTKLKYLRFRETNFLPIAHFDSLLSFQQLKELELSKLDFKELNTSECIEYILLSSSNLEKVSFENCDFFNGALFQCLLTCHFMNNLKNLKFENVEITLPIIESFILKAPRLELFEIFFCNLIRKDMEEFIHIKSLCLHIMEEVSFPQTLNCTYPSYGFVSNYDFFHCGGQDNEYMDLVNMGLMDLAFP